MFAQFGSNHQGGSNACCRGEGWGGSAQQGHGLSTAEDAEANGESDFVDGLSVDGHGVNR